MTHDLVPTRGTLEPALDRDAPVDRGRWKRRSRGLAGCAAGAVVVFGLCLGRAVEKTDEAWFLWVAVRLARGETLYRDVYSVTTPLSHWIASAAVRVTGPNIATMRFLTVVCFVTSVELARRIVARAGIGTTGQCTLIGALFVAASPAVHFVALYSWLAITLAMAAWAVSTSPSFPPRARWIVVGVCCGLACLSKPNVGVAALAAALVVAARVGPEETRRAIGRRWVETTATFATAVGVGVAVVVASGASSGFVGDTILEKGEYARLGVSYLGQLGVFARSVQHHALALEPPVRTGIALLPLLTVAALVAAWRLRRGSLAAAVAALAFTAVGLVSMVPRPTPTHVAAVAPLLLSGVVVTWAAVDAPRPGPRTTAVLGGVVALATLVVAGSAIEGLTAPRSSIAAFASAPALPHEARVRRAAHRLRRATDGEVFILRTDAGTLYLAGGLRNPTPFDIPERTDFGAHDQRTAIATLRAHPPRFVCVPHPLRHPPALEARALERYVDRHSRAVLDVGVCALRAMNDAADGP